MSKQDQLIEGLCSHSETMSLGFGTFCYYFYCFCCPLSLYKIDTSRKAFPPPLRDQFFPSLLLLLFLILLVGSFCISVAFGVYLSIHLKLYSDIIISPISFLFLPCGDDVSHLFALAHESTPQVPHVKHTPGFLKKNRKHTNKHTTHAPLPS